MFCLLQSSKLAEPPAPAAPPIAVKVPETLALESARALEVEPEVEVDVLELDGDTFEVDGVGEGLWGGVQVGQLVPPLLQVVAKALALARARRAAAMRRVGFMGSFRDGLREWLHLRPDFANAPEHAAEGEAIARPDPERPEAPALERHERHRPIARAGRLQHQGHGARSCSSTQRPRISTSGG